MEAREWLRRWWVCWKRPIPAFVSTGLANYCPRRIAGQRQQRPESYQGAYAHDEGQSFDYPPEFLASIVNLIQAALKGLQKAWRETGGETTARLEAMREKYGAELESFTNNELPSLLEGDLLKASARIAEKATKSSSISSETFERAYLEAQRACPESVCYQPAPLSHRKSPISVSR